MVIIEHLGRHTDVIPTLARWTDEQWGHLVAHITRTDMERRYNVKAASHTIPQTFVAMDGNTPVGMASLIEYDMDDRHDLTPWLASVYVEPNYRRQGLGGRLWQKRNGSASSGSICLHRIKCPFIGGLAGKISRYATIAANISRL